MIDPTELRDVFDRAVALPTRDRAAFLEQSCGDNVALRREVERLLAADARLGAESETLSSDAASPSSQGSAERAMSLAPGARLGPYTIVAALGAGGMGEVYKARDTRLDRTVAVKVLAHELVRDPTARHRFEREARAAAALTHPHICTLLDIGRQDDVEFLVMEYVDGETLAARLSREQLSLTQAVTYGIQIAEALAAAHAARIVHRDVKPGNVMLRPDGFVKVLDFGLAKLASTSPELPGITRPVTTESGMVVGTVAYMSPEQARGQEVDSRTDVWSLGCVLYEMVAGRSPFEAASRSDALAALLQREPAPLARFEPDAPHELQRIVTKALRKERSERYQTMQDLLLDLQVLREELSVQGKISRAPVVAPSAAASVASQTDDNATPRQFSEHIVSVLSHHRLATGVGALLLSVAVAAGGWWSLGRERKIGQTRGPSAVQRNLTRLTFGPGLQTDAAFSPDGSFVAYASDRAGNFDIWVQAVGRGDPVQVTHSPAQDVQPDWSPDGKMIVFRSAREGGGLFTVPALGGVERKLSNFGFRPRFSPDSSKILFVDSLAYESQQVRPGVFVVDVGSESPRKLSGLFWSKIEALIALDWHPDGRISVLASHVNQPELLFFTVSQDKNDPVRSEITSEVLEQLRPCEHIPEFRWSVSSQQVLLLCESKNAANVLSVRVDPHTLQWTGPVERLTLGTQYEGRLAVARSGGSLAFVNQTSVTRVWEFPLDDATGRLAGGGTPITPPDFALYGSELSPDGRTLTYSGSPMGSGQHQLWEVSLGTHRSQLRTADERSRRYIHLSRQNAACYNRRSEDGFLLVFTRPNDSSEYILARSKTLMFASDWSANGEEVVGSTIPEKNESISIVAWPVSAAPDAENHVRTVLSDSRFALWSAHYSRDGKWLCFNANNSATIPGVSIVGVAPASGDVTRPWVRITSETAWSDHPRWSESGSMLFYVAGFQDLSPNVWAVPFDEKSGRPAGRPIQVTAFDSPARGFWQNISFSDIGVARGRITVPITEVSGSIWMLDNADK